MTEPESYECEAEITHLEATRGKRGAQPTRARLVFEVPIDDARRLASWMWRGPLRLQVSAPSSAHTVTGSAPAAPPQCDGEHYEHKRTAEEGGDRVRKDGMTT